MKKTNKIFLTGASGGIGSAICEKFISHDFTLVLTSSSDERLLNLKNKYGSNHFYYKVDFSNEDNFF